MFSVDAVRVANKVSYITPDDSLVSQAKQMTRSFLLGRIVRIGQFYFSKVYVDKLINCVANSLGDITTGCVHGCNYYYYYRFTLIIL